MKPSDEACSCCFGGTSFRRLRAAMFSLAAGIVVATILASSAVHADVVTLSCSSTLQVWAPEESLAPTQVVDTILIDFDTNAVKGPAGTATIAHATPTVVTWISPYSPYSTTMCQWGSIDRVTGEFQNFIVKNPCQDIPAFFAGQQKKLQFFEEWRGFCKPAKKMF